MNIFGQSWNTLGNWDSQKGNAEALRSLNGNSNVSTGKVEGGSTLPSLRPGQAFMGQVLNITSQDVTILLDNLQTIHAKLGESVELNIGQKMMFEVKEQRGEQIVIRPMDAEAIFAENPAAEKALDANGFAFTERNLKIANELMKAGMPLDKDTMRNIMQQSVRFPEADIKQLVDMNRLQIPVNEGNIRQFAQYAAHEHQLTQSMNQVLDGLEQAVNAVAQSGDLQQMQELNQQMLRLFGWNNESQSGNMTEAAVTTPLAEGTEVLAQTDIPAGVAEGAGTTGAGLDLSNASATFQADSAFITSLQGQMSELGMSEHEFQQMVNDSKDFGELLSNISNYLEQEAQVPAELVQGFFQSENYGKLLKKGIREQWLMKPEDMKHPKEIDQLYEKIYEQTGKMEEYLKQSGQSNQEFSKQSQNMRENMQFMQQLNQQFVFAQLPMKMNGQEANSELFVYANKKKVQQGADGVKVLLHLDMPNLGGTDILVHLKDKKLHARFTLEDQTSVSLIADNMEELTQKLEDKGFLFTNEVSRLEPKEPEPLSQTGETPSPDAVVEEMFNQDLVTGQKRFTFDMRT